MTTRGTKRREVSRPETVAQATLKYHRGSAQKMRLVVDQLRGRNVNQALALLRFSPKEAARPLEKLLRSAVANAVHGEERIDVDTLFVGEACVGPGPSLKRVRGRAFGRAFRILHRTCHVTLKLGAKTPGGAVKVARAPGAEESRKPARGGADAGIGEAEATEGQE
jgi:large subunit ribosomal protein L22